MLQFFTAIKLIALASYLTLALLTLRSNAGRRVRIFFSIYLFGMLSWQVGSVLINFTADAGSALTLYNFMIASSGTYTILFFPFTRALLGIRRQRVLTALAYAACVVQFVTAVAGLQLQEVSLGRGGYWVPEYKSLLMYLLSLLSFVFWGFGLYNLVTSLASERSPVHRNRIMYILIGASVTILGAATNLTGLRDYPVDISANLASAVIIGYAVVRHKLMDIKFILARSLFYSLLTASLIAAYLGFILSLEGLLKHRIGYTGSTYGIIAIAVLALLFLPLRNLLQSLLDKIFFREKADYQRATQSFSREIASLYEPDAILDLVGETLAGMVRVDFVAIALLDERRNAYSLRKAFGKEAARAGQVDVDGRSALARWLRREGKTLLREEALPGSETLPLVEDRSSPFADPGVSMVAPILLNDRLLGMLVLGQKLAGTMFNDEDLRFLATLANQAATALEKSEIFRDIRRRLSEQTLLFILSEKFRGSADFDSLMDSIVEVLRSFLGCDRCAIAYLDMSRNARVYARDRVSRAAAEVGALVMSRGGEGLPSPPGLRAEELRAALRGRGDLEDCEVEQAASLQLMPLLDGDSVLGLVALSPWSGRAAGDERETELFRTIGAILSQGIMLYRTIVNLTSVEAYNEKILDSLNDMGDTLVILRMDGVIKRVSPAACSVLGYREDQLIGQPMGLVADDPLFTEEGLHRLEREGPVSNREMNYRTASGSFIPMLFSGSAMVGEDGKSLEIVGIARDMTEHRKAEEATKNQVLIQEIHHRIKNNLQVISSFLHLQAAYVKDEGVRAMFTDSQNRVRSMALIHEKLYGSGTPSTIAFSEYISDLSHSLFSTYSLGSSNIACSIDVADISLGMDTAVPCGLIINELVSNSLKHAFPENGSGNILIRLRKMDGQGAAGAGPGGGGPRYELAVSDDGIGFPSSTDYLKGNSLGLKIVRTLTHQLHGEMEMESGQGTTFTITFSEL